MSVGIEALFTNALGLQAPWNVRKVALDTSRRRIDFNLSCSAKRLPCPHCAAPAQGVHDRLSREWRHLDFFQFEVWLHAEVPRVTCSACGKTSQIYVPWAREGSGFTALFEALALSLCQELPVRQAAALLRCSDKQLWRRIEHYISQARALEDMSQVKIVGIDETSLRKGQNYITVVHDLDLKRLLFACEGRDHQVVVAYGQNIHPSQFPGKYRVNSHRRQPRAMQLHQKLKLIPAKPQLKLQQAAPAHGVHDPSALPHRRSNQPLKPLGSGSSATAHQAFLGIRCQP